MKRTILGIALGLSAIAAPALADTIPVGDISGTSYSNTESFRQVGGGTVDTSYEFSLSQSSIVHMSLLDGAKLTGLTATLYSVLPSGEQLTIMGPLNSSADYTDWTSTSALGAGTYRVDVVGAYASRGNYTLELSSDVAAPVPGPAGFLVAGAGSLIVAARRRRKAKADAALA